MRDPKDVRPDEPGVERKPADDPASRRAAADDEVLAQIGEDPGTVEPDGD